MALVSGCTGVSRVSEYGKDLKANFVSTCTTDVRVGDGTTSTIQLAPERYCVCVYDKLPDSGLSFDDLKAYEAKVAKAKAGENPPEMPRELRKAMDDCEGQR